MRWTSVSSRPSHGSLCCLPRCLSNTLTMSICCSCRLANWLCGSSRLLLKYDPADLNNSLRLPMHLVFMEDDIMAADDFPRLRIPETVTHLSCIPITKENAFDTLRIQLTSLVPGHMAKCLTSKDT